MSVKVILCEKLLTYKVVKANDLIESKSAFTALQHKIILLAMCQIRPRDTLLKSYFVSFQSLINLDSNYGIIRSAYMALKKSFIKVKKRDTLWVDYPFVAHADEVIQGKKKFLEIRFHPKVQKFLIGLKRCYTSYTLSNVINFKHNYSLRIYELCKRFQSSFSREITVSYLRLILSLEEKYKNYSDFRRRILLPSIQEINQYSDIFLAFKEYSNYTTNQCEVIYFSIRDNQRHLDMCAEHYSN